MTTEEKAEAYDKALEHARNLHKDAVEMENSMTAKTCEIIFPELAESEDEKIRKHLIKHFRNKSKEDWNGVPVKSVLAWLEKQGEQKPSEVKNIGHNRYLDAHREGMRQAEQLKTWLKSLRQQYGCVPSDY